MSDNERAALAEALNEWRNRLWALWQRQDVRPRAAAMMELYRVHNSVASALD